jgi:hypothetical protein
VRRAGAVVAALLALAALGACGSDAAPEVAPPAVDVALAPPAVGVDLALHENLDDETVAAFANAGEHSLVGDGRIWEIRRADRLVGALQISTVLPDVDLADGGQRESIVRQIIAGSLTRIRIDDVEVYTTVVDDKAVYVWFGRTVFEVLQLKDRELDGGYEDVAAEIIRHQATVPSWEPLPVDVIESG